MRDFNHTVNVLVKAYFKGELKHGNCQACAVGNICNDAGAPRFYIADFDNMPTFCCGSWKAVFVTTSEGRQIKSPKHHSDSEWLKAGHEVIAMTGYSVKELAKVEYAFETAPKGQSEDEWMFNGLMAVVDVLAEIHQIDLAAKEEAKLLF